jgi:hypothetical protein
MKVVLKRDLYFGGRYYKAGIVDIDDITKENFPPDAVEYDPRTAPPEAVVKADEPIAMSQLGRSKPGKPFGL